MARYNAYPPEVIEFVRENAEGKTAEELSVIVNEKFGTNFDKGKMKSLKQNYKIRSGRKHLEGRKKETDLYPKEVIDYIMQNYIGVGHSKMAKVLNEKFGTEYTTMQMKAFYGNRKLNSGITGYFESGHIPPNKGKKGIYSKGSEKGWFGKGHVPFNRLPIGTICKKSDGYLWRKIGEGSRDWKQEHILRYEEEYGPIPEGFRITFLDGNRENVELSNLALVSAAESLEVTRQNLRSENPEITKAGIGVAKLCIAIRERKKEKK